MAQVPSLENYLVELTALYEGRLEIWIEQNGYELTLHLTDKTGDIDLEHMLPYVVTYDSNGRMSDLTILSAQQTTTGMDYTGIVPVQGGKLILLDPEQVPVMEACLSN